MKQLILVYAKLLTDVLSVFFSESRRNPLRPQGKLWLITRNVFFYRVRPCFVLLSPKIATSQVAYVPVFSVSSYSRTKSVSLWAWNGEGGGVVVLRVKKKEGRAFLCFSSWYSSYAEKKLKILQIMGEVYSVLSSQSLVSRLIMKYFPADHICCQSGQVLSGWYCLGWNNVCQWNLWRKGT